MPNIKDGKVCFGHLGTHAAHACNLFCEGCSHFSDHKIGGVVSLENLRQQLEPWTGLLNPIDAVIAGGEPSINKDLPDIVRLYRYHFPESNNYIISNGFFLPKMGKSIIDACLETNTAIKISIHHLGKDYLDSFKPIKLELDRWKNEFGVKIIYTTSVERWTRRYLGYGDNLKPFTDNDPESSYNMCSHRYTQNEMSYQLFEGKIWKCPPLAYLNIIKKKYKLSAEWDYYLTYAPLNPTKNLEEILEFVSRGWESFCSMCPAYSRPIQISNPILPIYNQ